MIAILLAWVVISFILLSFGDIFIFLYNKLCKEEEQYNIPDTLILGICFVLIPLSLSSLWLPSNHYTLFAYCAISSFHWIFNKERLKKRIREIKASFLSLSTPQKAAILLAICSILLYVLYCKVWDDALYYHYPQIRLNEEYAVIPGLGNIEDRFGFNSNYLLLSAIFTFRFLLGEPIYALQSILFIYIMIWVLKEVVTSGFHISRMVLLFFFLVFFSLNANFLSDSSTDIVPNICVFYFIARFTLYPELLNKRNLFAFILPVTLCTFKMSVFPLCIFSLYIFFILIKEKRKALPVFLTVSAISIIGLWLVRNIIISGYLVYPLNELNIFSFDWKIPEGIAKIQREIAIGNFAQGIFKDLITFYFFERSGFLTFKIFLINNILVTLFYLIIIISPFFIYYISCWKKDRNRQLKQPQLMLYITLLLSFTYWLLSAPDVRFASGIICGTAFFILNFIVYQRKDRFHRLKTALLYSTIVIMVIMSVNRSNHYHRWMEDYKSVITPYNKMSLLIRPFSAKDQQLEPNLLDSCTEYNTNGITIYVTKDGNPFGRLPRAKNISPHIVSPHGKLQSVETVEARGYSLKDGFRTKKEYISIIDSTAEKIIIQEKKNWW